MYRVVLLLVLWWTLVSIASVRRISGKGCVMKVLVLVCVRVWNELILRFGIMRLPLM